MDEIFFCSDDRSSLNRMLYVIINYMIIIFILVFVDAVIPIRVVQLLFLSSIDHMAPFLYFLTFQAHNVGERS